MAKRPGKYAHVVNTLPKFPGDDPERRELIERVKAEILAPPNEDDPSVDIRPTIDNIERYIKIVMQAEKRAAAGKPYASEFARVYAELRMIRDRIGSWDASVGLLIEAYQELMTEQLEVEGTTSLTLASGQTVSTFLEPYSQVFDKEVYRLWCIEEGLDRQMSLPWPTTNSLTKARLLAGEPEPPGVKLFVKTQVRLGNS